MLLHYVVEHRFQSCTCLLNTGSVLWFSMFLVLSWTFLVLFVMHSWLYSLWTSSCLAQGSEAWSEILCRFPLDDDPSWVSQIHCPLQRGNRWKPGFGCPWFLYTQWNHHVARPQTRPEARGAKGQSGKQGLVQNCKIRGFNLTTNWNFIKKNGEKMMRNGMIIMEKYRSTIATQPHNNLTIFFGGAGWDLMGLCP